MIERQVIVTWYTPEEKLPEEDVFLDVGRGGLTVDAWADLEPYGGNA